MDTPLSFLDFREEWLSDITAGRIFKANGRQPGGFCAACGRPPAGTWRPRPPAADQRDRARQARRHPGFGVAFCPGLGYHARVLDEPAVHSRPGAQPAGQRGGKTPFHRRVKV